MTPTPAFELDLPEIDIRGVERADALAALAGARRRSWLARNPLGFTVMNHDDVTAILRDKRWHSALSLARLIPSAGPRRASILTMEGDEHTRLRRLVAPAFTPAAADRLRPFIRTVITELVDQVSERGRCELVADVCEPYPIPIICELLGAPKEDWKLFSRWASDIFRVFNQNVEDDLPVIERASGELDAYVRAMVDERRARPAPDLLSDLIAVEEQGDRLSTDELVMLAEAVLMAGTDTTRNQLGCSVAVFAGRAEAWERLGRHPELAPRAVEESMRYLGAVRGTTRFASEDIVYRDVLFPAGTLVMTSLAAANHDPAAFASAEELDLDREGAPAQMTFGSGIHFCLGAALARAELQEALPVLARRLPHLALDGAVEWKPATFGIWGPARLPLRFTPTARA